MSYFLLAFSIFLFLVGFSTIFSVFIGRISPIPSMPSVINEVIKAIRKNEHNINDISDIGSGYGYLTFRLAKAFPNKYITGYEISIIPYLVASFVKLLFRYKNVSFVFGDVFKNVRKRNVRISCAVVYLCLSKHMTKNIKDLYDNNISDMLIVNTYPIGGRDADYISKKLNFFGSKVYVYEKRS